MSSYKMLKSAEMCVHCYNIVTAILHIVLAMLRIVKAMLRQCYALLQQCYGNFPCLVHRFSDSCPSWYSAVLAVMLKALESGIFDTLARRVRNIKQALWGR